MGLHVIVQDKQTDKKLIKKFFNKKALIKTKKIIRNKSILLIRLNLQNKLRNQIKFKKIENLINHTLH